MKKVRSPGTAVMLHRYSNMITPFISSTSWVTWSSVEPRGAPVRKLRMQ